jgi:hypothetical protein
MPVPAPKIAMPSLDFLPGPLYFCAARGDRTPIVYEPRVETLCRRHPEMGPCQYEREACRAKGGRVFTGRGEEVTLVVEAEYDRVVRRVRFQGDSGAAPAKKK